MSKNVYQYPVSQPRLNVFNIRIFILFGERDLLFLKMTQATFQPQKRRNHHKTGTALLY